MVKRSPKATATARLVVDPDLSKDDRELLINRGGIPRSGPPPGGRPIPLERPPSTRFLVTAGAGAALVVATAVTVGAIAAVIVAVPALLLLAFVGLADMSSRYMRNQHLRVVNLGGRYITPRDLDDEGCELLARVQAANDAILGSSVARAGLLDHVGNRVILPCLEWELAQGLRGLAELRAGGPRGPRAAAAEAEAAAGLLRRVTALEDYADQVRAADAAYALAPVEVRQPEAELNALSGQAQAATEALREVILQAAEAAGRLPLTG